MKPSKDQSARKKKNHKNSRRSQRKSKRKQKKKEASVRGSKRSKDASMREKIVPSNPEPQSNETSFKKPPVENGKSVENNNEDVLTNSAKLLIRAEETDANAVEVDPAVANAELKNL